jgi:hypothetical protein
MKKSWIWDSEQRKLVPKESYKRPQQEGVFIQGDIEPYKALGGDMAGKMITSRSQHREFLKRNGFIEVGNEHREFFEHGGKSADNPYARRNPDYARISNELKRGTKRRS